MDPKIFKAYDIRGTYPDTINEEIAEKVGRAFVTYLGATEVAVGRDMRVSGPALWQAVVKGITEQGCNVVDIGMVGTDQYYHACATLKLPGMMVTASHNPPQYNGFKMVREMPFLLSGADGIPEVRDLAMKGEFPKSETVGTIRKVDLADSFTEKVLSMVNVSAIKPLKVVMDTGNGMVGPAIQRLMEKIPQVAVIPMYFEPDGTFPNHGGDPLKEENRRELQARVVSEDADLGFAFDGDGDRFFCIDDKGRFIPGDFMTALLAEEMLLQYPNSPIVYDCRASWCVKDLITAGGGTPLMNRVGHAFIKRRLRDENACFGGEVSGHYYFKDFHGADSGMVPALKVLEMVSRRGKKMAELLSALEQKYFITGEINFTVKDQQAALAAIKATYTSDNVYEMDGYSVEYSDWHMNVRSSNTEPLLRLNLEALSQEMMESKRDEVIALIKTFE